MRTQYLLPAIVVGLLALGASPAEGQSFYCEWCFSGSCGDSGGGYNECLTVAGPWCIVGGGDCSVHGSAVGVDGGVDAPGTTTLEGVLGGERVVACSGEVVARHYSPSRATSVAKQAERILI